MTGRAVALFALAALASLAQATTYTCVGADGRKSFSDRPCPVGSDETARKSAPHGPAARHGLTFGLMPLDASFKEVRPSIADAGDQAIGASCDAPPAPVDRPRAGACDPYVGDTVCTRSLPLLCIRPGVRAARAPTTIDARTGKAGPPALDADSLARIGSGPVISGERLQSESAASALCEQALGPGWRMARFHDDGGWRIPALRHSSLPVPRATAAGRFWVAIADQRANCWDPIAPQAAAPAAQGARAAGEKSAAERELLDHVQRFRSGGNHAKLSPRCQGIYDRVERSLRQANGEWAISGAATEPLSDLLQHCSGELARIDQGDAPR